MPARFREIGPETSDKIAVILRRYRDARKWSRPEMSRQMGELGYDMGTSTIRNIENGVSESPGTKRRRLLTVDEAHALIRVFGASFATEVIAILEEE